MKIVRIIARLNVGGPARHVIWLTAGLQSDECECLLVAGSVPAGEDDMSYFATENSVTPIYVAEMSREISVRDIISIWKIYKILLRERPDIVHTHTAKAGTVGRLAALLYRLSTFGVLLGKTRACKVLHTYHGHIFHSYYGWLKTRVFLLIEKMLARLATNRIVVISRQQRKEINETFGVGRNEQFVVIPLGLDLSVFRNGEQRRRTFREYLGAGPDDLVVGIVGRLTEVKNHEMFLSVVKAFKDRRKPSRTVRFVVIGSGSLRSKLEEQAQRLGLTADVTFAGNRSDPEYFYPALDIVALTSRNEGTPLTLIEAMANARPTIATAVGGVVDLLGKPSEENRGYILCERGILVPPGDTEAFAAGLGRLVDDDELRNRMGEDGLMFVQQNYSKDRLLADLGSLYSELMPRKIPLEVGSSKRRVESRV